MTDPLLTVAQVAQAIEAHPETVRRWIRQGLLRVEHVGPSKRVRVRMSVLTTFYPAESLNITLHKTAS